MRKLLFIALLFCLPAFGQVTVSPFVTPNVQFLSNSGTPLAGGKVCTFAAGSTTPQTSYSDSAGSVANANPVVLDSAGRASIWLTTQTYKIVVAASTANSQCSPAITSTDNISWATMANTVTSLVDTGALTVQASAAATSGANQSSPLLCVQGNYWTGAASASDKWCLQDLLGTGSNPTTTLNVTHGAGSSGTAAISLPVLTVTGASTLSGPSPWYDVLGNGIIAGVDGSTALNSLLTSCTARGGEIFFPINGSGMHYKFSTATSGDGGSGCLLRGNSGPVGPIAEFTGSTANLSLRSTSGIKIQGMAIENSNAGFSGNIVDMGHGAAATDSSGNFVNHALIAGLGVSAANSALSLDKTIFSSVQNSNFQNAANLIQLAASNTSYSNGNRIINNILSSATGTCSNAMILNPAQGVSVIGNGFELGVALGNCAPLAFTASAGASGLLWAGNWHGDSNSTVDRTLLNWNVTGGALVGNYLGGNSTHDTIVNVAAGASIAAYGNNLAGAKIGFDVSAGNAFVDIAGNDCRNGTVTTQLNGTPAQGRYQDCSTGVTNYYGGQIFTSNAALIARNAADAEQDIFIEPGSTAEQLGCIVFTDKTHAINKFKICKNASSQFQIIDAQGTTRSIIGNAANSNYSIDATGSGTIFLNGDAGSGTAGVLICSAGTCPTLPAVNGSVAVQGNIQGVAYNTATNCSSSASPAVCAAAAAGSVAIANPATTIQVNTTAVTASSQIFVQEDSSLGTKLGVTCNATLGRTFQITARVAATSFTITASATPAANSACLSYSIVN